MSKHQKSQEIESDWKKAAPCLYRYRGATYYMLVKINGKQIRQSLDTTDFALAKRLLVDKRKELESKDHDKGRLTLADFRERFVATLSGAPSTIYKHKLAITYMIDHWPSGPDTRLTKINNGDCKALIAKMEGLAPATQNDRITTMSKFFELAKDDKVIASNPMDGIKYRKRERHVSTTPTHDQFRAIVGDLRAQKFNGHDCEETADYLELAGVLGLGQAELSGIRRQDVDLEAGLIKLFRRKTKTQFTIPIFPDARAIIERRLASIEAAPDTPLLKHANCKRALAGSCRRLGFPSFEPRSLRRYHITRALRAGVDVATVAKWQGHQDGGILILKTYAAEVDEAHSLKQAAKLA